MSLLPRFRRVSLAVLVLSGVCAAEPAPAPTPLTDTSLLHRLAVVVELSLPVAGKVPSLCLFASPSEPRARFRLASLHDPGSTSVEIFL